MDDQRTDDELIAAANVGEREAFEALYYRYRSWVMAVAYDVVGNDADAEEVLQDVYRYFFGKFPGFTLTAQLKTFLYPAIRNRAIDIIRKRKPGEELEHEKLEAKPHLDEDVFRERVRETVAHLPEEQRDVLILRFVDGLKLSEIADRLGIPTGTVKSRLSNSLTRLRREMESNNGPNNGVIAFLMLFA